MLEQLHGWRVLDRSYDGARAASLAEYRNRHYVYQFTQAGYRAYRAVEDVLGARVDDAVLSRLVFPELLEDLVTLARANEEGDAEEVYRKLNRLDSVLADIAERAARFYLLLGDLSRTTEASAEVFLAHKDALLANLREFTSDLARYTPKLAAALGEVEASGVDRMVELAASVDERIFRSPAERLADWRNRWVGLAHWFRADSGAESEAERLQAGTVSAIAGVLALLRRVTEARRGGVSRESQLRHLAAWFAATGSDEAAHALFAVTFDVGAPRHVSVAHPDAELIPTRRSWWEAPPVAISRTLVETGKPPSPGAPARVERNDASRRRLRESQVAEQHARRAAAAALAGGGVYGRTLDEEETELLLALLDIALGARVPVSGVTRSSGWAYGVTLTLSPSRIIHSGHSAWQAASRSADALGGIAVKQVPEFELAGYQRAVRTLLANPLVTETYPHVATLPLIRRWADRLREDLGRAFGYRLELGPTAARLVRTIDELDHTRPARTATDRPFDRKRYAYLALTLATLGRAGTQLALSELADAVAADAGRIDGLGLSTERAGDRAAFVDAVAWLEVRGALQLADGSARRWADDPTAGEALYDIDRDMVNAVYRPKRVLQHIKDLDAPVPPRFAAPDGRRRGLAEAIDLGLPRLGVLEELTVDDQATEDAVGGTEPVEYPLIEDGWLATTMAALLDRYGSTPRSSSPSGWGCGPRSITTESPAGTSWRIPDLLGDLAG